MVRTVGFERGWQILNAGCGSGSFLPLFAALVGPNGAFLAQVAETVEVAPAELAVWRSLRDRESPEHIINAPTFYWREGHVVTVGRVPQGLTS
jgi:tRNA A58 N-methylase Trm61